MEYDDKPTMEEMEAWEAECKAEREKKARQAEEWAKIQRAQAAREQQARERRQAGTSASSRTTSQRPPEPARPPKSRSSGGPVRPSVAPSLAKAPTKAAPAAAVLAAPAAVPLPANPPAAKAKVWAGPGQAAASRRKFARMRQEMLNRARMLAGLPVSSAPLQQQLVWENVVQYTQDMQNSIEAQIQVERARHTPLHIVPNYKAGFLSGANAPQIPLSMLTPAGPPPAAPAMPAPPVAVTRPNFLLATPPAVRVPANWDGTAPSAPQVPQMPKAPQVPQMPKAGVPAMSISQIDPPRPGYPFC
jgi:hypothetical protein